MATIRSIAELSCHEIDKVKGSRFLATVAPVGSVEDIEAVLHGCRSQHRDATHHCYAWRLGSSPDAMRYSDDGEPSGTAGRPILQEIDGRDLQEVLVVVTRYYGGTKLGTGGLLRAYAASAAAGLDHARVVERRVVMPLHIRFEYAYTGPVSAVLSAHQLEPVASDYGSQVSMHLAVPVEQVEHVRRDLVDATQGSALVETINSGVGVS